jgi:transcriptional regulator with XRE-family HTH domain
MADETKDRPMEDFGQVVDEYGESHGDDLLTDRSAEAEHKAIEDRADAAAHGERIKAARELRGFTIQELSDRTNIESNLLQRVEAGEALLPLGQLIKVSKALELPMAEVLAKGEQDYTIVRAGQGKKFERYGKAKQESKGYEYESLAAHKKDRRMEPFIVTLMPASADEPSAHDGQEFIYVLDGQMEVIIEGKSDVLNPGDCVYYDSTINHLVRAYGDKPARILAVLIS